MKKTKVIYGLEYEWTTRYNITYWWPIKKSKIKKERNNAKTILTK